MAYKINEIPIFCLDQARPTYMNQIDVSVDTELRRFYVERFITQADKGQRGGEERVKWVTLFIGRI